MALQILTTRIFVGQNCFFWTHWYWNTAHNYIQKDKIMISKDYSLFKLNRDKNLINPELFRLNWLRVQKAKQGRLPGWGLEPPGETFSGKLCDYWFSSFDYNDHWWYVMIRERYPRFQAHWQALNPLDECLHKIVLGLSFVLIFK